MIRRLRRHPGAAIAAVLLGAGPLLAAPAYAQPEAGGEVTFSGGSGLLGCTSQPDRGGLTVHPFSTVIFHNNLGGPATLRVVGRADRPVGNHEAVPVEFDRGPVSVSMVPECLLALDKSFGSVTVEVARAPVQQPAPAPGSPGEPDDRNGPAGPAPGDSTGGPASRAGAQPDSGDPSARTGQTTPPPAMNPDGTTGGAPPDLSADTGLADDPALRGMGGPAAVPAGSAVALEPVVPASSVPVQGVSSLLALIATVCAVGVAAAAIRAILSQRASRLDAA